MHQVSRPEGYPWIPIFVGPDYQKAIFHSSTGEVRRLNPVSGEYEPEHKRPVFRVIIGGRQ